MIAAQLTASPIDDSVSTELTTSEQQALADCEATIHSGVELIGTALRTIRDRRLYRDTHATFKAYCLDRWEYTDRHVRRLIGHADVLANVADLTTGPNGSTLSERATRAIADLPPAEQRTVVGEVLSTGEKPTAKAMETGRAKVGLARSSNGEPAKRLPAPSDVTTDASFPSAEAGEERAYDRPSWPIVQQLRKYILNVSGWKERQRNPEAVADVVKELRRAIVLLDTPVMAIRTMCKAAESWTDPEAVADVVDEMRKWISRLSPTETEADTGPVVGDIADEFMALWNTAGMTKMVRWTSARRASLRKCLKDPAWRDGWKQAIEIAGKLAGLCACKQCDVDWFFRIGKAHTVNRLLEGFYSTWIKAEHGVNRKLDDDSYGEGGVVRKGRKSGAKQTT